MLSSTPVVWDSAREFLELGFSVIPLNGKIPYIPWTEFQIRPPTLDEVQKWEMDFPSANLGIVTGKVSGLIVIDIDSQEGIEFCQKNKISSPIIQSTGKGWHQFYSYSDASIKNSVRFAPGCDIRSDGGYVVIAPSIHENGRHYKLHLRGEWDELPDFPSEIISEHKNVKTIVSTGYQSVLQEIMANGPIFEGSRDNSIFKIAASLISKYREEEALMLLQTINRDLCKPPLSDKQVQLKLASAMKMHNEGFKPLEPLDQKQDEVGLLPEFPLDSFPDWCARFIESVSNSFQVPTSMVVANLLGVMSTVCSSKVCLRLLSDWINPVNLYLLIIDKPGTKKSPVQKLLIKPIQRFREAYSSQLSAVLEGVSEGVYRSFCKSKKQVA